MRFFVNMTIRYYLRDNVQEEENMNKFLKVEIGGRNDLTFLSPDVKAKYKSVLDLADDALLKIDTEEESKVYYLPKKTSLEEFEAKRWLSFAEDAWVVGRSMSELGDIKVYSFGGILENPLKLLRRENDIENLINGNEDEDKNAMQLMQSVNGIKSGYNDTISTLAKKVLEGTEDPICKLDFQLNVNDYFLGIMLISGNATVLIF